MQPAPPPDEFGAGAEIEVVRVREEDLRPHVREIGGRERLDGRLRADGHEDGRVDPPSRRRERAETGGRVRVAPQNVEGERAHSWINMASP